MRYQLRLSMKCTFPLLIVALVFARSSIGFADESLFKREKEIIYGRKHGLAMTLDIFKPLAKRSNRGIVFVVSGGWFSAQNQIDGMAKRLNWMAEPAEVKTVGEWFDKHLLESR